jgi:hypothetical protein
MNSKAVAAGSNESQLTEVNSTGLSFSYCLSSAKTEKVIEKISKIDKKFFMIIIVLIVSDILVLQYM